MPHSPPIIAVLDDEPEMRKALRRLLLTHGFLVEVHARGEDLLTSFTTATPDCLILDLHMPGLTGFDVLTELESRHGHPPVVIITGHDEPGTEERARGLGAVAYLTKPVDQTSLLRAIETAMAEAPKGSCGAD